MTVTQAHEPTIGQEPDGRYLIVCTAGDWTAEAWYPTAALVAAHLCRIHTRKDNGGMFRTTDYEGQPVNIGLDSRDEDYNPDGGLGLTVANWPDAGLDTVAWVHDDMTVFVPSDCQAPADNYVDEGVPVGSWVELTTGRDAVIINGAPRLLA